MRAGNLTGAGTVLTAGWNGAPALCLGVPTSAVISKAGLFRSSPAVLTEQTGSSPVISGTTATMSRKLAILYSLTGRATAKPTMWELSRNAKMGQFIPSRAIPMTLAGKDSMLSEVAVSTDTACRRIKIFRSTSGKFQRAVCADSPLIQITKNEKIITNSCFDFLLIGVCFRNINLY